MEENQENDMILHFINNASSNDESVRQEATQYLQSCTFKLQLIPTFENILSKCIEDKSQSNIYYCLLILRDTIINRGCLYSPENHMSHIENLFSIAESAIDLISNNIAILNVFSDAVSFSYRFIFEITNEFPKIVFQFFESSENHKIISISILNSILNAIERCMPHYPIQSAIIDRFKPSLSNFYDFSLRCMSISPSEGDDPNAIKRINILGVELFNKTTEFATNNLKLNNKDKSNLSIGLDYFKIENCKDIINCLFHFFNEWDPQNAIKAGQSIRLYLYLCNLAQNSNVNPHFIHNKIIFNSMLYLIYCTSQLIPLLISSPENEHFVQEGYDKRDITPLLIMISNSIQLLLKKNYVDSLFLAFNFVSDGKEIEGAKGSGNQIIYDFICVSFDYTKIFLLIDPSEFFIFWKIIAQSEFNNQSIIDPIKESVKSIFEFYVNYLIEVNENLERKAEDFFGFSNGGDFIHGNLWGMMRGSIVDAANIISKSIDQIVEDERDRELDPSFAITYQRMIIITTLFTSFINDYSDLYTVFIQHDDKNDFGRAFEIIFVTIINFIMYHSGNLNERLNIIGEVVAKAEYCFACLFNSFYIRSKQNENVPFFNEIRNNIQRQIKNEEYKIYKIEHFFIDHFVDVIKIFTPFTDLILFIFNTIETVSKHDNIRICRKNTKLREIATERIQPFDLETVPFIYLQKVIPKMYKIYSSVVEIDEWDQFISTFDPQFSDELACPPKCFLLYSQLYGVSMYISNIENLITKTFEWMLENHFEDTLKCLQTHYNDKVIVSIIVKFWRKMSCINSSFKDKIFTDENGNGIIYFRSNVQILLMLKELCEDSQWISMKLIHNCICGDYANYGIMELFQDNSLDVILENFFYLIQNWAIGENSKKLTLITQIIEMFPQIEITGKILFSVEENLFAVLGFLTNNLLLPNEDNNKKKVWIETCKCLYLIIADAVKKSFPIRKFSQFFIIILDALITLPFNDDFDLSLSTSKVLYLLMSNDTEFCNKVTRTVIESFESDYIENVNDIFEKLWMATQLGKVEDHETVLYINAPKDFTSDVVQFSNKMKTYHIEIANIEVDVFQAIFRRTG